MKMSHVINWVIAAGTIFSLLVCPSQSSAQVSYAGVDQVLASLADVVKERAQSVATRTIVNRLKGQLCECKQLEFDNYSGHMFLGDKSGKAEACKAAKSYTDAEFIFSDTCRLTVIDETLPLTDTHFLKTLSKDTVKFATRLSAYRLNKEQYQELGIGAFADFLFELLELEAAQQANSKTIAQSFERLLTTIKKNLDGDNDSFYEIVLKDIATMKPSEEWLQRIPKLKDKVQDKTFVKAMLVVLQEQLKAECHKPGADYTKLEYCTNIEKYVPADDGEIRNFDASDNSQTFDNFFGEGKQFDYAKFAPCKSDDPNLMECSIAEIGGRFVSPLAKLVHRPYETRKQDSTRRDFRQYIYIYNEKDIYIKAMKDLGGDEKLITIFVDAIKKKIIEHFNDSKNKSSFARASLSDLLEAAIATSIAMRTEETLANKWLGEFKDEFKNKGILELQKINSLSWETRKTLEPSVQRMRDAIKQLINSPQMFIYSWSANNETEIKALLKAIVISVDQFKSLNQASKEHETDNTSTQRLVTRVKPFLEVIGQMLDVYKSFAKEDVAKNIETLKKALDDFSPVLDMGADRDWVGFALLVSSNLDTYVKNQEVNRSIKTSLGFVRALLSMYQAKDKDEAKGIFKTILEAESSRELRFYSNWTGDIAALLGAQGGWIHNMGNENDGPGYGLFVPFGVQIGGFLNGHIGSFDFHKVGLLIYPIDLGGYVSKTNGDDGKTRVQNALRSGVSLYYRFSASVPVVFGAAVDYLPPWEKQSGSVRTMGFIGLELPIFTVW